MADDSSFEQFKIRRFGCWDLFLHKNQYPYLGRCYASARRPDADLVTDMDLPETSELFGSVIPSWSLAVTNLFGVHRPNIAFFGNDWPHLHAHLIPRYRTNPSFADMVFPDPNPQGNYTPYPKRKFDEPILFQIRDLIKEELVRRIGNIP